MKRTGIILLLLMLSAACFAQSNLVDVKALVARDYFKLGSYKIIGINNDGNLVSNSALEIPTVAAVRAYVGAFGGGTGGGGGILDSVKIIGDTLYQYRAGIVSKTAISLYPCNTDFGDIDGIWSDNTSLVAALATKQNTIVHPNVAGYWFNGFKQWENKDSSVRASMVAIYDSAKAFMSFSPRSNLMLYRGQMPNFDTTSYYGGVYRYNAAARGTRPTTDGSGMVIWINYNDSNYFNGIDNSIQMAVDKKNNGFRSRSWEGSTWGAWRIALDSTTATSLFLPLATAADVQIGIGYKKRTATPAVNTDVIFMQSDGTTNMRWWYSTGQYVKFDTTGMGTGNINVMLASLTQQGNSFNLPSTLVKLNALGYLPTLDASNLTNLDINKIALGAGTARQVVSVNNAGTAIVYRSLALEDISGDGDMALQNKTAIDIRGGEVYGLARLAAPTATSGTNNNDVWINNSTNNLSFRIGGNDYKALTAENNLSGLTNAATARSNLGVVAVASSGSAADLSTGTLPAGRLPAHTGDVTSSAGSAALAIASGAVTQAKTASYSSYTIWGNNTNASAAPANIVYQQTAKQTYSGTFTWDGTAPTGSPTTQYQWTQIGKMVTVNFWATYTGTAGVTNTSLDLTWPGDLPVPEEPSARTSNNDVVASGYGYAGTSTSNKTTTARSVFIIRTGSGTYKFNLSFGSTSAKVADFSITYFVP